jgi:TRAP-type C4-dicarboxylate transport system permease small subunit
LGGLRGLGGVSVAGFLVAIVVVFWTSKSRIMGCGSSTAANTVSKMFCIWAVFFQL